MKWRITLKRIRVSQKTNERGEQMTTRPTFEEFKNKALQDKEVQEEYNSLAAAYEFRKKLIRLRKEAGLTQEKIAEMLKTKKSNISRLENVNSNSSPKLSTIEQYANVIGYRLQINFIPKNEQVTKL